MGHSLAHVNAIHGTSKGYITLANKVDTYKQWHYTTKNILEQIEKVENTSNVYISQNSFYKPQRRIDTIKQLRNCFIDIDCYKANLSKEAAMYLLEQDYYGKIPRPNLVLDSGRGLYLIWTIEPVPKTVLPLWKAVMLFLYNELKSLGADANALDATRILRVAGTINSKTNTPVTILDKYDYVYKLSEIQEGFMPSISRTTTRPNPSTTVEYIKNYTTYNLHYHRLMDLVKVCELRNYDVEGKREIICFLYRYWGCCYLPDPEEALMQTLDFNDQFTKPLSKREVEKATKSAELAYKDRRYNYKNETLIELLEITEEEQTKLVTIISQTEKNRRRRVKRKTNVPTKRQREKQTKKNKAMELKIKGLNQIEIAEILGVSKGTVSKYLD